jgi:hypothetical protein
MTNWRVLEYDYELHEGKHIVYPEFDSIEIKPDSEQSDLVYSSGLGPLTTSINPQSFKKVLSPNDIVFLKEGDEAFRFTQVEELEKLTKVIKDIDEQLNLTTNVTTDKTKPDDQNQSKKGTKVTIKCSQCGKSITTNSKFCNYCGARMTPVCSKCNHENPIGSHFCSNCGFVLN